MSFEIDITLDRGDRRIAASFDASGALTALFGRSGIGKTSVLDMIAGLLTPARGRISVAGHLLFDADKRINLPPEARGCGYVFQDNRLFPHMRVRDNLLYGATRARSAHRWMTLDEACGFLGIADLLDRMPATLSGG